MRTRSVAVELTAKQKGVLQALVRAKHTSQQLAERSRIVLMSAEGLENAEQARELGVDRQRVRRWRHRWANVCSRLVEAERGGATSNDLRKLIVNVLGDKARSGAPPKFTPEQVAQIIALGCESPCDSGLPVSHWTPSELAREAMHRGIVESISARQVDRFLARRRFGRTKAGTG